MLAPVSGTVTALADVPDSVFATGVVGPGLAIEPGPGGPVEACSPIEGTVTALRPHAFVIHASATDHGVLVHLGIDTIELAGVGFELHVEVGDTVRAGQRLLTWDPDAVRATRRSALCPVIAVQADEAHLAPAVAVGGQVTAGEPLLEWT